MCSFWMWSKCGTIAYSMTSKNPLKRSDEIDDGAEPDESQCTGNRTYCPKMKRPNPGCTSPHWYPSSVACSSLLNAISTCAGLRQVLQPYGILLVASTWLTPLDGLLSFFCNLLLRGYSKYAIPQGFVSSAKRRVSSQFDHSFPVRNFPKRSFDRIVASIVLQNIALAHGRMW